MSAVRFRRGARSPAKGEKRGTRLLRISKAGDGFLLRVMGGPYEGTHALKQARPKH